LYFRIPMVVSQLFSVIHRQRKLTPATDDS
jgi:hypothetical protein